MDQRTLEPKTTDMLFWAGDPFPLLFLCSSGLAMSNVVALTEIRSSGFEIKFVLDAPVADTIVEWAHTHLERDPHGSGERGDEYLITNLCFDTETFHTFHRRGSYGRAKYRARRYGNEESLFLERKLRKANKVNKRRTQIRVDEIGQLNGNQKVSGWPGNWFHRRLNLRGLEPACQVAYRRTARVATTEDGTIRLTADRDIRVWPTRKLGFVNGSGNLIGDPKVLVELKFPVTMPALFAQLIDNHKLEPVSVSKFRLGINALYRLANSPGEEPGSDNRGSTDA